MTPDRHTEPPIPALQAWGERADATDSDRVRVDCWMPRSAPWANLQTVTRGTGADRHESLSNPLPLVNLHLAGVSIGGYLDDMEQYIDAARDALRMARYYADQLQAAENERNAP